MTLLLLALGPVIIIFFFVWARDRYEREPLKRMILTVVVGAASAVPIVVVELLWGISLEDLPGMGLGQQAFAAFVQVGLTEEFFKGFAFMIMAYWSRHMNEPYDGIVYAVSAALGFAAIENILYVISGGIGVALLRSFTAVPGHAMMGLLIGYFAGRAKFAKHGAVKLPLILTGFILAVLVHGAYDFVLFATYGGYSLAWLWLIPLLGVLFVVSFLLIKDARDRSPFKPAVDEFGNYTGYTVSGYPVSPQVAARLFKKVGHHKVKRNQDSGPRLTDQQASFLDEYLDDMHGPPRPPQRSPHRKDPGERNE